MKNLNGGEGDESLDRLSKLPDSLILEIFRDLPMREVVRTSLLSKRWKTLWTTTPFLNFEVVKLKNRKFSTSVLMSWLGSFKGNTTNHREKVPNLVSGVIESWTGVKIFRFNVELKSKYDKLFTNEIDSWVAFVVEKEVEELKISLPYKSMASEVKQQLYLMPQNLYSCSSLKELELRGCQLQIAGNVQWDQLKRLRINGESLSADAIDQVVCGSPQLQSFYLCGNVTKNLSIRSSSLKWLCIGKFSRDATELRIWTPNLKTFYIFGAPYRKYLLMNVTSLTEACLEISDPCRLYRRSFPEYKVVRFVGAALTQILPTIKHVERVTLSETCIKALVAWKDRYLFSPFPINVKFLKLGAGSLEFPKIVRAVEMFPELRNLVLVITYNNRAVLNQSFFKFDNNLPLASSFLLQLRTVDVTWPRGGGYILPLIQFFLKHARCLEKMILREERIEPCTLKKSSSVFIWEKSSQLQS